MPLRVLLITPVFYEVENEIKKVLEESDYEVVWIENKTIPLDYHGTRSKLKFLRRIFFLIFSPHKWYIKRELNRIENARFDILLSINAHIICPYLLKKLKNQNPEIYSILYLWDAFSMYNWKKELTQFNKVFTIDKADSIKFKIEYKPIFWIQHSDKCKQEFSYDSFFTGKFTSFRLDMIDKILKLVKNSDIKYDTLKTKLFGHFEGHDLGAQKISALFLNVITSKT